MNIALKFRDQLPPVVRNELDNIGAAIITGWRREHNGDGTHKSITATGGLQGGSVTSGGTLTTKGAIVLSPSGVSTPNSINSDQNNYSPDNLGQLHTLRLSSNAARILHGLSAGTPGQLLRIWNIGGFAITFKHASGTAAGANRLLCPGSVDFVLGVNCGADFWYDLDDTRWRIKER